MPSTLLEVMGEVAGAGAALAGLILVFMGATTAAFEAYDPPAQKLVRPKYQQRIWLAFAGLAAGLSSTALAIIAKAGAPECIAWAAVILLTLSGISVLIAALLSALDIR